MACSQTLAGINLDCGASMGGIKKVWLAPYVEGAGIVTSGTSTGDTGEIQSFSGVTGWYVYNFRKNTGSMTSTLNVDPANGVNYVSTELSLVFTKMDTAKRIEMSALAFADAMAVVEDANGNRWFLGKDEPLAATAGTGETGTAKTDGNKYTITLTDESLTFPYKLDDELELVEA